jgi:hypothetical protein
MRVKFAVFILVSLVVFAIGSARVYLRSQEQTAQQIAELEKAEDRGSLKWYARLAKAKGQNRISMMARQGTYGDEVKDLNDALRYYQMILAVPIEKQSRPFEDAGIRTWYKFKIVEKLSHKQLKPCDCVPADLVAPEEMFPLRADEILIPRAGGSVMVDGIEVTQDDVQYPQFALTTRYLLFLRTNDSGQIGLLGMGPAGVFVEQEDDRLEPLSRRPNALTSDIATRFRSSIQLLRDRTSKE